jgi:AraC family transcriptional regulator
MRVRTRTFLHPLERLVSNCESRVMSARNRHALVTMGSPSFRHVHAPSVDVISAWFPANARLDLHTHARAVFGVMLEGSFCTHILNRDVEYLSAGAWTEPAEERHANVAGRRGANVLIVQPGAESGDLPETHRALLDEIVYLQSSELLADAARLEAECTVQDDLSGLVVEGTALAMLARAARLYRLTKHHGRAPAWLFAAIEYLHAHRLDRIKLGDVARGVGVHPSRLAHEFRARYGQSPGEYVRRLRLEWAAEQLRREDANLADVAIRAGFYDQSHFSRMFRRLFGVAPAAWRRGRHRGRA